jgi:SAM-dependent methyltransferase
MCPDVPPVPPADHWSRVDYRRLIAWPERIRREWPFIAATLGTRRPALVIDLGCGTGEHSRELAAHGFDVVGIDSSPAMLERAADQPVPPNVRFVEGDVADVAALVDRPAQGAICLGNTMPHLDDEAMRRFARGLATVLEPGAPFLFQVLNYERIRAAGIRYLPLNFIREDGEEIVFLRLMAPRGDGTVIFSPTTLRYRPDAEVPVEVETTRSVKLRAWTWAELRSVFGEAGFRSIEAHGSYDRKPFEPEQSPDIIGVATR